MRRLLSSQQWESPLRLPRRTFLSLTAGSTLYGWLGELAARAAEPADVKSCILLWMSGGPSHLDTFDLKPEGRAQIRGEFKPIDTSVPGLQISEHFPQLARRMQHAAVLRSMSTVESDHQLATYHVHTGYQKRSSGVAYPSLGSLVSRELGRADFPLPNYVCIGGQGQRHATRSGFLGPDHQPLDVGDPLRGTDFLEPLASPSEFDQQLALFRQIDAGFQREYRAEAARAHASALDRAVRLMNSQQKRAFDLTLETEAVQERYGPAAFGQGCLMARRLVETGVRFVEVQMGDTSTWDTHRDNFPRTRALSQEVDVAMSALIDDLKDRGLLDTTLVVWMGEFGRTPQITSGAGRNHWARAWSSVLVGGGVRGGQVVGQTDRDAAEVLERPISVVDFLATVCTLLGIDYTKQTTPPGVDRPIPLVDTSKQINVVSEVL